MGDRIIGAEVVEDFLRTLTETEAGPDEWPEYQNLLDALDTNLTLEASPIGDAAGNVLYRLVGADTGPEET